MATTVFLVRHGQTPSNVTGFHMGWSQEDLSEAGYEQARRLSARMAALPLAAVYASPLRRTLTTAAIIAGPHRLEPEVLDDLVEIRLGDWEGLYPDEISRRWPELWRQSRTNPSDVAMPNGESFAQVTERAIRAFNTVTQANVDRQVVLVTHLIVVRVLAAYALGVANSIYRKLEIANASLSIVRITDSQPKLVLLNDTSHLED
ncbi:MAG: histidine phosphatase family protein [Chloroflexota bacterium]